MKKIYYESPTVEVVDVRVEAGFAPSDVATNGGITDYSTVTLGEMDEVGSY